MEELKSAINWFEIPATDFDRAVRFYCAIYTFDMSTRGLGHVRMGFFQHTPGGGTVVQEKTHIAPEIGYFAIFDDTEGNRICLHSMN